MEKKQLQPMLEENDDSPPKKNKDSPPKKGKKIDPEILLKLARFSATHRYSFGFAGLWRLIRVPMAVLFVAGFIVMFAMIFQRGPASMRHSFANLEDLELLLDEPPDFYRELEFYSWLAARRDGD